MEVPVSEAKALLSELVRRAEAGEEVILTRFGRHVARVVPAERKLSVAERRAVIEKVQAAAEGKATAGPCAAQSQSFLYDQAGLPA